MMRKPTSRKSEPPRDAERLSDDPTFTDWMLPTWRAFLAKTADRRFMQRARTELRAESGDTEAACIQGPYAREYLAQCRTAEKLLAFKTPEGRWCYPMWQFARGEKKTPDRPYGLLPGIAETIALLRPKLTILEIAVWLRQEKLPGGFLPPLTYLRNAGGTDFVIDIAYGVARLARDLDEAGEHLDARSLKRSDVHDNLHQPLATSH